MKTAVIKWKDKIVQQQTEDLKIIQDQTNLDIDECQKYYYKTNGNVPLAIEMGYYKAKVGSYGHFKNVQ